MLHVAAKQPAPLPHVPAIPVVKSAEEGRAILERVRYSISMATYEIVSIERIRPMQNQPRKHFNPERILRLSESIKQVGQITPGYLRKISPDSQNHDRELVDGERRYRAILMAGISTFRAMLVDIDDEAAQYIVSVIANFNRVAHTTLEIADAIRVMREQLKIDMEEIAESIGFHPIYCTNLYGLYRLTPEVRDMLDPDVVKNNRLPVSAAIQISRMAASDQLEMAQRVMRREVNLRMLRSEVVKVSQRRGVPIQERHADPAHQLRTLERKIAYVRRNAADLLGRLKETRTPVLMRWRTRDIRSRLGELEAMRTDVDESIRLVGEIIKQHSK